MSEFQSDVLLTYAELAEKLSIKPDSAKRLVLRRKWSRIKGNDGLIRVKVPLEAVPTDSPSDGQADSHSDSHSDNSEVVTGLSARVAHLEGLIEGMKGELEAERKRADAAEARTKDIAEDRDAWRVQAQRSVWSKLFGSR